MRGFRSAGVVVAAALFAAGCGGSGGGDPVAATTPPKVHSTARPTCLGDDPTGTFTWAGDSEVLMLGGGTKGVVLAPQIDGNACSWTDEMHRLAKAGYRVAVVSYEDDRSKSLPAAVQVLMAHGATKVVLMGASAGGGLVVDQAGAISPAPAGVIAVSPVEVWSQRPGPEGYKGPMLLLESKSDNDAPVSTVQALIGRHPGGAKSLYFDGDDHGYSLVMLQDRARPAIDAFLRKTLG
ncbi:alpha/beta hydrolase [Actinomadura harenae]|uniref:Alpha/beta hydrolase n=1 Tax=Actinomadura harenae TaxID=2483351 RepID=A0A3M2M5R9_9ACTN|nr:hypothetical protein [Actinomadura harenae]RMI45104.1 hypothetical protein EBO15_11085 [Actinomadura harenae]